MERYGKNLTSEQRAQIKILKENGGSNRKVAAIIGCTEKTVRETGSFEDRNRSGRSFKLTTRDLHTIVIISKRNRRLISTDIASDLQKYASVQISRRSVRRYLAAYGLFGRVARARNRSSQSPEKPQVCQSTF